MAKIGVGDKYANIAYLNVTESAANTLTFAQLQLATTLISEKAAVIIHRAEMFLVNTLNAITSSGDYTDVGISLSDRVSAIHALDEPENLFFWRTQRFDFGAAASGQFVHDPQVLDFTQLPGGGILVPADRLYIGICGSGEAAANSAQVRLHYTVKPLQVAEYWDLIEARRVMTT